MESSLITKRAMYKIIRRHQSEGSLNLKNIRNDYKQQKKSSEISTLRSFSALPIKSLDFSLHYAKKEKISLKRMSLIPEYPIKTRKLTRKH